MRARWSDPVQVRAFYDNWEVMPSTPGVYIIRRDRPLQRVGGTDPSGILYVGRASSIRNRIWSFWDANHTASGFLWTHPSIARLVLNGRIRSVGDVERELGKLTVRYATPVHGHQLGRAERALLFAYFTRFGEAPPLNLNLTSRWAAMPSAPDLRWAEKGLQRSA